VNVRQERRTTFRVAEIVDCPRTSANATESPPERIFFSRQVGPMIPRVNLRLRLALLYSVAFFASSGATLLTLGFFYFTRAVWGWNAKLNLSLAASMNVAYVVSSLSAHAISTRFGRRRALAILYAMMTACCAAASFAPTHLLVSSCLLVYMFFTG